MKSYYLKFQMFNKLENLVDYVTVMMCIAIDGLPRSGIIHQPFKSKTGILIFYFVLFLFQA